MFIGESPRNIKLKKIGDGHIIAATCTGILMRFDWMFVISQGIACNPICRIMID